VSQLARNVHRMENAELIGLAKNRFLDSATQLKIAEHRYRRAKWYLAENPGLCIEARDHLWSLRGYTFKTELLSAGHYAGQPEYYRELYKEYSSAIRERSRWRMFRAFIGGNGWSRTGYGPLPGPLGTPPEILEDIYEKDVLRPRAEGTGTDDWHVRGTLRGLLENPNLPTDIVVKVSASEADEQLRNIALRRLGTLK